MGMVLLEIPSPIVRRSSVTVNKSLQQNPVQTAPGAAGGMGIPSRSLRVSLPMKHGRFDFAHHGRDARATAYATALLRRRLATAPKMANWVSTMVAPEGMSQ